MNKDIEKAVENIIDNSTEEKKEQAKKKVQLVVFKIDNEEYAVPIDDAKEIIKFTEVTSVPNSPEFITGIINLRGKIVVIVDLEKRFNLVRETPVKSNHIIISETEKNIFGIIIDEVAGVINVSLDSIQPTPSLVSSKIKADYLCGVVILETKTDKKEEDNNNVEEKDLENIESRLIVLLDLPKMLEEDELLSFTKSVDSVVKNKE